MHTLNNHTPTPPHLAACHRIMTEKCQSKKRGKDFQSCYRSVYPIVIPAVLTKPALRAQLCNDPKVCTHWKERVCCKDDDNELNKALNVTANKHSCRSLAFDCRHKVSAVLTWALVAVLAPAFANTANAAE